MGLDLIAGIKLGAGTMQFCKVETFSLYHLVLSFGEVASTV